MLANAGRETVVLDNLSTENEKWFGGKLVVGDLADQNFVCNLFEQENLKPFCTLLAVSLFQRA